MSGRRGGERNRRFLDNLQKNLGAGSVRRQVRERPTVPDELLPNSFEEFLSVLDAEKRDLSLVELSEYYRQRYRDYEDDHVTQVAERLFKIGFEGEAIYDFVGFLNVVFVDERFQEKIANEFVLHAALLFDEENPELSQYEEFGRFIGLLLKTKFNRPYHQIVDTSNKLLVAVMNVFLGFLDEIPLLIDSGDEEDQTRARLKTTAVVWAVKALNRRLYMDHYELNDKVYKFFRAILIDSDGKSLGKDFRRMIFDMLIEMEKFSVAGAPASKTSVGTQT